MNPTVIYEDKNILAVNKPAGLLTHSSASLTTSRARIESEEPTLVDWIIAYDPKIKDVGDDKNRPGIVHRLDRDTSGILLIAKNQKTFLFLKRLFQERNIKKTYRAIVYGETPREGIITKSISAKTGSVKKTVHTARQEKSAITRYKTIAVLRDKNTGFIYSLIHAYPETGRTHQIRVHLAAIGHPVVGDSLYKKKEKSGFRQLLHAESVEFNLEDGNAIRITADPPDDFSRFLASLKKVLHKDIRPPRR